MRISDWSSDVCSSDLLRLAPPRDARREERREHSDRNNRKGEERARIDSRRAVMEPAAGARGDQCEHDDDRSQPRTLAPHHPQLASSSCLSRVYPYVSLSLFSLSFTINTTPPPL